MIETSLHLVDCWILGRGTSLHAIHYQYIGILFRWCQGGFCSWLDITFDGYGEHFSPVHSLGLFIDDLLDRMDLLLRLHPPSYTPKLHRFLCPPQRTACIDTQQQTYEPPLCQWPRNNPYRQPRTTDVYIRSTQWLRDFLACIRVPRRSGRPTSTTSIWPRRQIRFTSWPYTYHSSTNGRHGRAARSEKRCHVTYRISIPCESNILL